jgi:DNA-binding transcriptional LysR family regulator
MLDRLTSMSVFVKAADAGSFAAASSTLGLSAQMIAKHVAHLEDRLGARLLNRTTRRQSLTEMGTIYYQRCKTILEEVDAADSLAAELQAMPRGQLRISAPATFGAHRLAPMITRYLRTYPDVEIDLALTDRSVDLIEEGFEVAFRIGPLPDSRLKARALAPYRLVACASPQYLEEHGVPQHPADLAQHECLGYAYWSRPVEREWRFTRQGEAHIASVHSRLNINDAKALWSAAIDGFGIVLGPEIALQECLANGSLIRVMPDYEGPSRAMHLLFSPDKRQTPKLRSFIDFAVAAFSTSL